MEALSAEQVKDERVEEPLEAQVKAILASRKGSRDELIPILQDIQNRFGYLPGEAMSLVAEFLRMPESTIYGVATFYAFFKLVPTGKRIVRVCRGTACHVRGGARVLKEVEKKLKIKPGESTPDLEYYLETVACIGACALAPTMTVDDETHGQMTPKKADEIFENKDEGE